MSRNIKLAVIGVGRWGRNLVSNFSQVAEVSAVSDKESSNEAILVDPRITGVVIATPPTAHVEIATRALQAGKHVFVEKPAGTSTEETAALTALAAAKGRVLMVGYVYVYHPAWVKIKQLLSERGETFKKIEMSWLKWGTFDTPIEDNLLCHDIALAVSAFPNLTSCALLKRIGHQSAADELVSECRAGSEVVVVSSINRYSKESGKTVRVVGSGGTILRWEDEFLFEELPSGKQSIEIEAIRALEAECRAFIKAIETNQPIESNGEFAVTVRRLLDSVKPQ